METRIWKGREGWQASTVMDFDGPQKLEINTYKGGRGGLVSIASVKEHRDGMVSFTMFGDYMETVRRFDYRCTEKNIRAVHAEVITQHSLKSITVEARAFYAAKADKREAA